VIARHLQPAVGDLLPEAIGWDTLDGYHDLKHALSGSTIDRHLRILRAALDHYRRASSPSSGLALVANTMTSDASR
jgi:hypothetical protein